MLATNLTSCGSSEDKMRWAFRIFDVDNSKSIAIDEFGDSIRQVWTIFDGIGETEHNPGTCENVSNDCHHFTFHIYLYMSRR